MYQYKCNVYFTRWQHIPDIADILVEAKNSQDAAAFVRADFKDAYPQVSVIAVQHKYLGEL